MKKHPLVLVGLLTILAVVDAKAQNSRAYAQEDIPLSPKLEAQNPSEAWKEIEKAANHFPASSYSETSGSLPAGMPQTKYVESWLLATADKAREFYTKFPNDTNAAAAKKKELEVLWQAINETYATNQFRRFFTCANAILRDAHFDRTNRFNICNLIFIVALQNRSLIPLDIDVPSQLQEAARIAERDFQDLGAVHLFSWVAEDLKAEKERPLFREFLADLKKAESGGAMYGFPYRMMVQVLSLQRKTVGKPISFQFVALDGQAVDTAMMKGKIVAMIFGELPIPSAFPMFCAWRCFTKNIARKDWKSSGSMWITTRKPSKNLSLITKSSRCSIGTEKNWRTK